MPLPLRLHLPSRARDLRTHTLKGDGGRTAHLQSVCRWPMQAARDTTYTHARAERRNSRGSSVLFVRSFAGSRARTRTRTVKHDDEMIRNVSWEGKETQLTAEATGRVLPEVGRG